MKRLFILIVAFGLLICSGLVVACSSKNVADKCLPKQGIQICYPNIWKSSESKAGLFLESPIGRSSPFLYIHVEVIDKISKNHIVTEEELHNAFYSANAVAIISNDGGDVTFSFPKESKHHFGGLMVSTVLRGIPEFFTDADAENRIQYMRQAIRALFPTEQGFLAISCTLSSKENNEIPSSQKEFAESLLSDCYTMIAKADAT